MASCSKVSKQNSISMLNKSHKTLRLSITLVTSKSTKSCKLRPFLMGLQLYAQTISEKLQLLMRLSYERMNVSSLATSLDDLKSRIIAEGNLLRVLVTSSIIVLMLFVQQVKGDRTPIKWFKDYSS